MQCRIIHQPLVCVLLTRPRSPILYNIRAVLVNVLDSSDKVTVNGWRFTVNMKGYSKVYTPSSGLAVTSPKPFSQQPQQESTEYKRQLYDAPQGTVST